MFVLLKARFYGNQLPLSYINMLFICCLYALTNIKVLVLQTRSLFQNKRKVSAKQLFALHRLQIARDFFPRFVKRLAIFRPYVYQHRSVYLANKITAKCIIITNSLHSIILLTTVPSTFRISSFWPVRSYPEI